MPKHPLLILPSPEVIDPPAGSARQPTLRLPEHHKQIARFGPVFSRLERVLSQSQSALALSQDPTNLAPERVIVFEVAGGVRDFAEAVARVPGLEFMAELESEIAANEDFALLDTRKGQEGRDRVDKPISSRFYLAMPDMQALQQLLSLWRRWERKASLGAGFAAFAHLFAQLHDVRPWGPSDRIPDETIEFWQQETSRAPKQAVRTEVEIWFHHEAKLRQIASERFHAAVKQSGGVLVDEAVIPEIAYHGALIDIPSGAIPSLIAREPVQLAVADDVMFLRPQSLFSSPIDGSEAIVTEDKPLPLDIPPSEPPIAALFDGVPVTAHTLLSKRLILDDPDDLQSRTIVSRRLHGTAMASLILHGDRNIEEPPLDRPIYVRPLMHAPDGKETTETDRLLVDTIYRAVLRMKGSGGEEAAAPTVFLVNLSMGDPRRPFAGVMSPLARLLDFLSERYSILFLVSAGNVSDPLVIGDFSNWTSFEKASPETRERAVIRALASAKHDRTILSPSESINSLTVGAHHHDHVADRRHGSYTIDPFTDALLPNVSSGLGLGFRRSVKPEIYFAGGREHVTLKAFGDELKVGVPPNRRLFGLKAAAPDQTERGDLALEDLVSGTSAATALATRAAHQIFDALMDKSGGSLHAAMDPQYYAVVVKALLVHRARWSDNANMIKGICGPTDRRQHVARSENVCRFLGFGIPVPAESRECASSRATMVGYGALQPNYAHEYTVPLPECLEGVTDPRALTVTLAWFSPVKPGHQTYRQVKLEASTSNDPIQVLGVRRGLAAQPADPTMKRGTIFHERFSGAQAVPFINDGHLSLQVWCKDDAGGIERPVRYGIVVTIEAESDIPVYNEIRARLLVRLRPR